MSSALQVSSGVLLMLFALLDIFLTVLYARAGTGILSRFICGWEWRLLRQISKLFGRRAQAFLSLCGPAVVISLISWWALILTVGAALIFHPYLGSAITTSDGPTPTDFISALYAAANSMSIVGASGFSPHNSGFRLIFMFNSLVGMSVISLTLTYLTQIYNALQQRNALGLHLYLLSGMTGSSAEMLARIVPRGQVESGFSTLASLASSVVQLKELHHFYPVLLYFRFQEEYYSVSFVTSMVLDGASLIETAMEAREYEWMQASGTVEELWSGSLLLLDMVADVFSPAKQKKCERPPTEVEVEGWRREYLRSLDVLNNAGVQTAQDVEEGARRYVELREKWAHKIEALARSMLYSLDNVDPGHVTEGDPKRGASFPAALRSAPLRIFVTKEK